MQSAKKNGLSYDTVLKGEVLLNILLWDLIYMKVFCGSKTFLALQKKPSGFQDNVVSENGTFFNTRHMLQLIFGPS